VFPDKSRVLGSWLLQFRHSIRLDNDRNQVCAILVLMEDRLYTGLIQLLVIECNTPNFDME
jgi:hypothetical protein